MTNTLKLTQDKCKDALKNIRDIERLLNRLAKENKQTKEVMDFMKEKK